MTSISWVDPREVPQVWPVCFPMLKPAIERSSGRFTEATVFKDCLAGNYALWLLVEDGPIGALVTQVITWPTGLREAHFVLAGGENHRAWMGVMPTLETWAKQGGCGIINAAGRPGWERELSKLPGWKKYAVEMEKSLA